MAQSSIVKRAGIKHKGKRHKVGEVDFDCPNCHRELHRTVWIEDYSENPKEYHDWGPETAFAFCSCGAQILVAYQPDGSGELYWVNREKMKVKP